MQDYRWDDQYQEWYVDEAPYIEDNQEMYMLAHQHRQQTTRIESFLENISTELQAHKEIDSHVHQNRQQTARVESALDDLISKLQARNVVDIELEQPNPLMEEDAQELYEDEHDNLTDDYCELEASDEESLAVVVDEDKEPIHHEVEAEEEHTDIEEIPSPTLPPSQPVEKMELIEHAVPYYLFPHQVGEFKKNWSSIPDRVLLEHYRLHHPSGVLHGTQPLTLKKTINFKELLSWGP